jgi:hypothetical protein
MPVWPGGTTHFTVGCSVHIGREFFAVPAQIRKKLRARLEKICAVLEALESRTAFLESISESSLAITVDSWSFRYLFETKRNRLVVVHAIENV